MIIAKTPNFILENHPRPEVGRLDGGHLVINPNTPVEDRTQLSPKLVTELALLTNIAGMALKDGMTDRGIDIGRINYQDNGNWRPELHVHLYGRALHATYQTYGEPIKTARLLKDKVVQEPLTDEDCAAIRNRALQHAQKPGYESLELR